MDGKAASSVLNGALKTGMYYLRVAQSDPISTAVTAAVPATTTTTTTTTTPSNYVRNTLSGTYYFSGTYYSETRKETIEKK
jgi:hypothetical protein